MEQHSEEKKVKKEQLNNLQEQVNFLYQCLQQASSVKGGFELHDIKVIKESKDVLMNLFEDIDENILATDEDIEALDVLMKSIQIQQVKGAFNFDGALLSKDKNKNKKNL
jgi:hypothetical protein